MASKVHVGGEPEKKCPKVTDKLGGAMQTQLVPADLSPESAAGTGQCRPFHLPTLSKGAWRARHVTTDLRADGSWDTCGPDSHSLFSSV